MFFAWRLFAASQTMRSECYLLLSISLTLSQTQAASKTLYCHSAAASLHPGLGFTCDGPSIQSRWSSNTPGHFTRNRSASALMSHFDASDWNRLIKTDASSKKQVFTLQTLPYISAYWYWEFDSASIQYPLSEFVIFYILLTCLPLQCIDRLKKKLDEHKQP